MKALELVIGIIFFLVWWQLDIFAATAAVMVGTGLLILMQMLRRKTIEKITWITFTLIALFGGATLIFHNPDFIKWKPTILFWLFSAALTWSHFFRERPFIQMIFPKEITLPQAVWCQINLAWALFFFFMGLANLIVFLKFSEAVWVQFKAFGILGATLIFTLGLSVFLYRHMPNEPDSTEKKSLS